MLCECAPPALVPAFSSRGCLALPAGIDPCTPPSPPSSAPPSPPPPPPHTLQLEASKARLQMVTAMHVYSVQPGVPKVGSREQAAEVGGRGGDSVHGGSRAVGQGMVVHRSRRHSAESTDRTAAMGLPPPSPHARRTRAICSTPTTPRPPRFSGGCCRPARRVSVGAGRQAGRADPRCPAPLIPDASHPQLLKLKHSLSPLPGCRRGPGQRHGHRPPQCPAVRRHALRPRPGGPQAPPCQRCRRRSSRSGACQTASSAAAAAAAAAGRQRQVACCCRQALQPLRQGGRRQDVDDEREPRGEGGRCWQRQHSQDVRGGQGGGAGHGTAPYGSCGAACGSQEGSGYQDGSSHNGCCCEEEASGGGGGGRDSSL